MTETETPQATSSEVLRENAARGAQHLDKVRPGWFKEINTDTLALHNCSMCVLGQLFAGLVGQEGEERIFEDGYEAGLNVLCPNFVEVDQDEFSERYGFNLPGTFFGTNRDQEWDDLRLAWVEQIKERLDG